MSKAFIWVTSTLGGIGKTSLSAALWRLSEQGVLPQCEVLDLDFSPRLGTLLGSEIKWRSNNERMRALIQTMAQSTADLLIVNFPAGFADLLRELPDRRYVSALAKGKQVAQLHFVHPSMTTDEVELAFNDDNPLYASATAHFAVVPEHRMSTFSGLPLPLPLDQYVDATLKYPSWGIINQLSEVMSAALERRVEPTQLVEVMLNSWLTTVAENFDPLITWLNDAKPDGLATKEALHE